MQLRGNRLGIAGARRGVVLAVLIIVVLVLLTLIGILAATIWIAVEVTKQPSLAVQERMARISGVDLQAEHMDSPQEMQKMLNGGFKGYRIGDLYTWGKTPFILQFGVVLPLWHTRRFPGSIAARYARVAFGFRNAGYMSQIIDAVAPELKGRFASMLESGSAQVDNVGVSVIGQPALLLTDCFDVTKGNVAETKAGVAVIHIRIGDVLTSKLAMQRTGITAGVYDDVARKLKEDGITKAVLVGGVHQTPEKTDGSESVAYARAVGESLRKQAISSVMMSSDPDVDLSLLVEAKVLVAHPKSGFSRIAIQVRRFRQTLGQTTLVAGLS